MNRLLDRDASASKDYQFSYLYTWNFINDGKDEGSLGTEGLQIAFEGGIATEADFPSQYSSYSSSGLQDMKVIESASLQGEQMTARSRL